MIPVFPNDRVWIIAEAGVNHNGDIRLAKRLIDGAADAGADAVKFQLFNPDVLLVKSAPMADYQTKNVGEAGPKSQYDMLRELTLSEADFAELQQYAKQRDILFLCSPFDAASATFLHDTLQVPCLKIASGEITNKPFLEHIGRMNTPVILSTGMADMDEVQAAVNVLRAAQSGPVPLAVLQCVTSYPAPFEAQNLYAMATLERDIPDCSVGFSDHTPGTHISVAAVALGARIIEKHFTLDQDLPGPDHKASLSLEQLAEMVVQIRDVERALGNGVKKPHPCELNCRGIARKSLVLTRSLPAGHLLQADDLASMRPGSGISPMAIGDVLGKALTRDVSKDSLLEPADYQ